MKKRIISLVMVLTIIAAIFSATGISASAAVNTTASSSTVYAGPSSSTYPKIGSVYNESITAYWREGDYLYIRYNITGTSYYKCGYVHYTAVKNTNVPGVSFSKTPRISTISQNVYANWEYRNSSTVIGSTFQGEEVSAIGTSNDMTFIEYKISETSQLKRGWVPTNTLRVKTAPIATIRGAEEAIRWVTARLGSRSYDGYCLKFVAEAYNSAGVSLGAYANAKLCANGKTRYKDYNPPRGALVFFDYIASDGRNLGHVGISQGDGSFIHASTGRGVIISTLRGYNDSNYLGWSYPSN